MLARWASLPRDRDAPSLNIRIGVPADCEDNLNQSSYYSGTVENGLGYKCYEKHFYAKKRPQLFLEAFVVNGFFR
jgi:hypothetical protein